MIEKRRIQVGGIVQGVGFRPFVYSLAISAGLSGQVLNNAAGVIIEVEGETSALNAFLIALESDAPPLAIVERITSQSLPRTSKNGHKAGAFLIAQSHGAAERKVLISPDVDTCNDCLAELLDPNDRRYRYPFINCTHCGPRFTIVEDVPYDRSKTTMSSFQMCVDCLAEYENPLDRRFHAQPIACPVCGPHLSLTVFSESTGAAPSVAVQTPNRLLNSEVPVDQIRQTQRLLARGHIVAIKGLGGFHLACDPTNAGAVDRLRSRKNRRYKPFALMAADLPAIEAVCEVSEVEAELLADRRRPVVLLNRRTTSDIAQAVAPGQKTLGFMLPYTPLHHLLFADGPFQHLVMTSGNLSNEPIVYQNEEITGRLHSLADAVLSHNRPINVRCDDSVVRIFCPRKFAASNQEIAGGTERLPAQMPPRTLTLRRSRGYAPQPLSLGFSFQQPVLAAGAHLKNTFCLGKGTHAYLSQHIGDLDNLETLTAYRQGIVHFKRLFDVNPTRVAHDLHPAYLSTHDALEQEGMSKIAVQHHHAHIASVIAEHNLSTAVIGVAFDGTGYGPDGTIWGGEFLVADLQQYERVANLRTVALPGGEQAVRQPWRLAAAWLQQLYGDAWQEWNLPLNQNVDDRVWQVLSQMIDKDLNCPLTSSMGRLFDACASLLGIRQEVSYEGQAAIELEAVIDESITARYAFDLHWPELDPAPLFAEMLSDIRAGEPVPVIAAKFHNAVAHLITTVCLELREQTGLNRIALSGGVFQNVFLLARALAMLGERDFEVFTNERVPANDGGIALGQAAIAATSPSVLVRQENSYKENVCA